MSVKHFVLLFLFSSTHSFWQKKPFEILLIPVKTDTFNTQAICEHISHLIRNDSPSVSIVIHSQDNEQVVPDLALSIAFFLKETEKPIICFFTGQNQKYLMKFEQLIKKQTSVEFLSYQVPYKPLLPFVSVQAIGIELQTNQNNVQESITIVQQCIESLIK